MQKNRIPADQSRSYTAWELPEVKDGQIVAVEKLRQRNARGQLVNVDKNEVIYSTLTAGQLEEITNQAYEDVREQAFAEGLAAGRQQGYQEGLTQGQDVIARQASALQETIGKVMAHLAQQDNEIEQALVNLATCVAGAVLRRELALGSSEILAVVHEAVAMLPFSSDRITVFLAEQDLQFLQQQEDLPPQWRLQKDPSLTPGGCRIVTRDSVVDFTLEEQFQQAVNALVADRFAALAASAGTAPAGDSDG